MHSDEPLSQADIDLIRAHSEELKDHISADVQKYWDRINAHCPKRPPTEKSPPLPHQVETEAAMENREEKKTRLLIELCNQAETGATIEDPKENRIRLMIELGRIEREIQRRRNQ